MNKLFYNLFIIATILIMPGLVYNGGNLTMLFGAGFVVLVIIGYFVKLKKE